VSNLPWTPIFGVLAAVLLVGGVIWWKPWHQRGAGTAASLSTSAKVNAGAKDAAPAGAAGDSSGTAIDPGMTAVDYAASAPDGSAAARPSTPALSLTAATSTSTAAPTPTSTAASTPTSVSAATPAAGDAPGAGRARLRLSFSADSWVDVHDAQGRRVYAGNGRANSVKTIAGMAPMRVYLGFASGVQLEIDNRAVAIGPQFVAGDVAHFEAGADGILRRDSHGSAAPAVPSRNVQPTG